MRTGRRISYGIRPPARPMRRRRFRMPVIAAAAAAFLLLTAAGLGTAALLGAFGSAPAGGGDLSRPSAEASATFAAGTAIDGADVGGLTKDEALRKIEPLQQARAGAVLVTLSNGNYKVDFTAEHVAVSFNTDAVMDRALAGGAGEYGTAMTADPSAIEQDVRQYAGALLIQPFDAMVLQFDPNKPDGQQFQFSQDRPGQRVDEDKLWVSVKQAFETQAWGTIDVVPEPVPALVTKADLENNCRLVAAYQSTMRDHSKERLKNIMLSAEAITKALIPPGGEFSFNAATGERTAAKGYLVAHVINAGVEDNGLGGGVCQVSGTLFNAAARADLEIVKRTPHTIPSSYLNKGQDATVNYPTKDLVVRNGGAAPVILVVRVDQQSPWKVTAEVYGKPFAAGETIDLESKVDRKITAPAGAAIRYEDSDAVDPGTTKVLNPRDGYEITVYKLYLKDGVEIRREKFGNVTYQAAGTVVLYNPLDPKPSGLPTPTPSATPGPTPPPQTQPPTQPPGEAPTDPPAGP